jgi:hypothetical protein
VYLFSEFVRVPEPLSSVCSLFEGYFLKRNQEKTKQASSRVLLWCHDLGSAHLTVNPPEDAARAVAPFELVVSTMQMSVLLLFNEVLTRKALESGYDESLSFQQILDAIGQIYYHFLLLFHPAIKST